MDEKKKKVQSIVIRLSSLLGVEIQNIITFFFWHREQKRKEIKK